MVCPAIGSNTHTTGWQDRAIGGTKAVATTYSGICHSLTSTASPSSAVQLHLPQHSSRTSRPEHSTQPDNSIIIDHINLLLTSARDPPLPSKNSQNSGVLTTSSVLTLLAGFCCLLLQNRYCPCPLKYLMLSSAVP